MAFVRFVNTLYGASNVNIYTGETLLIEDLPYAHTTAYVQVGAGMETQITVQTNLVPPTTLLTTTVFFKEGHDYTALIEGVYPDSVALKVFLDDNRCSKKKCRSKLRFIHGAALAPTAVDFRADNYLVFENVVYPNSGKPEFISAKDCSFDFSVTVPQGSIRNVLVAPTPLELKKEHVYTLILIGDPQTELSFLILANHCHKY